MFHKLALFFVFSLVSSLTASAAEPSLSKEQAAFVEMAEESIEDFRHRCRADQSKLWGESLCVPMVLVEMSSKLAVSSVRDPLQKFRKLKSVYVGEYYGPQTFANTSLLWEKQRWSMVVSWSIPESRVKRSELLLHEAWHSIQNTLGLPMGGGPTPHLDHEGGRVLIRCEWSALLAAMAAPAKQKAHLRSALAFRQKRLSNAKRSEAEFALEMSEGLASYTGVKLRGSTLSETQKRLEELAEKTGEGPSLVRSFAYVSGPLYGLLLDRISGDWKKNLTPSTDLSELAALYFHVDKTSISWPEKSALQNYGHDAILAAERKRAQKKEDTIKRYLRKIQSPKAFVFDPGSKLMRTFDPNGILSVSKGRFLYLTLGLRGPWGSVEITDGALVAQEGDTQIVTLSAPQKRTAAGASGQGWELKLNEGWRLKKDIKRGMFVFVKD